MTVGIVEAYSRAAAVELSLAFYIKASAVEVLVFGIMLVVLAIVDVQAFGQPPCRPAK